MVLYFKKKVNYMPKTVKSRIIFLANYLLDNSDSSHSVEIGDIKNALENEYGEKFNIKTIYDDINTLTYECNMDIVKGRGKYRINSRKFTFDELQTLVDLVQSSKFISPGQTKILIDKIKCLTSKHEAKKLQRSVDIICRIKSQDETVLSNVGILANAIENRHTVKFHYKQYNIAGKLVLRRQAKYDITPYFLMIDNENYYLKGWDNEKNRYGTYRVDKMSEIKETDIKRTPEDQKRIDAMPKGKLSTALFGMFDGEPVSVRIRFSKTLIGAAYDVLGQNNIFISSQDPDYINIVTTVVPSSHFFGWILGLGNGTEILGPQEVREKMQEALRENLNLYGQV